MRVRGCVISPPHNPSRAGSVGASTLQKEKRREEKTLLLRGNSNWTFAFKIGCQFLKLSVEYHAKIYVVSFIIVWVRLTTIREAIDIAQAVSHLVYVRWFDIQLRVAVTTWNGCALLKKKACSVASLNNILWQNTLTRFQRWCYFFSFSDGLYLLLVPARGYGKGDV